MHLLPGYRGTYIWGVCTFGALQPTANFRKKWRGTYFWRGTYLRGFTVVTGSRRNVGKYQNGTAWVLVINERAWFFSVHLDSMQRGKIGMSNVGKYQNGTSYTRVSARHNWDARAPLWVNVSKGFRAKNVLSPSSLPAHCRSWEHVVFATFDRIGGGGGG